MPAKIPLLVLGIATDGPVNQTVNSNNIVDLFKVFGGYHQQATVIYNTSGSNLTETTSSIALDYTPWGSPLISDVSRRVPRMAPLYHSKVDSQTLSFGSIGPTSMSLMVSYRPYLGEPDLLVSTQNIAKIAGTLPGLVRVGGTYATLVEDGWEFSSTYPGVKYNQLILVFSASSLTILGGPKEVMTFDISASTIKEDINALSQTGYCPIECLSVGNVGLTGVFYLTGGSNGELTESSVEAALPFLDLSDVGAVLINLPLSQTLYTILQPYLNKEKNAPTFFITQAPLREVSEPLALYRNRIIEAIPVRHDFLVTVMGSALFNLEGHRVMRPAAEAVAATYLSNPRKSPSNVPIPAEIYQPILLKDELQDLLLCGVGALNRFIGSGISLYRGVTSSARRYFDQIICIQEAAFRTKEATKYLLGQPFTENLSTQVEQLITQNLTGLPYGVLVSVKATVYLQELFIVLELLAGGEIVSVNLSVINSS